MRLNRTVAAAAAISAALLVVRAQTQTPAAPPTAFILGQVVDAATNRPVRGAIVTLAAGDADPSMPAALRAGSNARRVLVDDDGRFLLRDLAKGSYQILASASGYLDGGYGQRRVNGRTRPFSIEDGQHVGDVRIQLWPEAQISGVVVDDRNQPLSGVVVTLLSRSAANGRSVWTTVSPAVGSAMRTDDGGAYRFAGLVPGDYLAVVSAKMTSIPSEIVDAIGTGSLRDSGSGAMLSPLTSMGPAVRLGEFLVQVSSEGNLGSVNALITRAPVVASTTYRGFATTFHPSARSPADADVITVAAGDDRRDVNIALAPIAMARVSGIVSGPAGPLGQFAVHLVPAFAADTTLEREFVSAATASTSSGAFTFPAVAPGTYVMKAWRLPQTGIVATELPADSTLWGELSITVTGGGVSGVNLSLHPGAMIRGHVTLDGLPAINGPTPLSTSLGNAFAPANWAAAMGRRLGVVFNDAGDFTIQGVPPGRYEIALGVGPQLPRGAIFESVMLGGKDLIVSPLVVETQDVSGISITYSNQRTRVTGTVALTPAWKDLDATVVALPADVRTWVQNGMAPLAARQAAVSSTGSFALDVRPGEYLAAVVNDDALAGGYQQRTVEAIAAIATRVTVARGDAKQVELKPQVIK